MYKGNIGKLCQDPPPPQIIICTERKTQSDYKESMGGGGDTKTNYLKYTLLYMTVFEVTNRGGISKNAGIYFLTIAAAYNRGIV